MKLPKTIYLKNWLRFLLRISIPLLTPCIALADGAEIIDGLYEVIDLLAGEIGGALLILAIIGSGFMFFIGRWDLMRLLSITIGAGLIFGAANLGTLFWDGF